VEEFIEERFLAVVDTLSHDITKLVVVQVFDPIFPESIYDVTLKEFDYRANHTYWSTLVDTGDVWKHFIKCNKPAVVVAPTL
jgi:hypothetical protein